MSNDRKNGSAFDVDKDHRVVIAYVNIVQSTARTLDLVSGLLVEQTTFLPNGARETSRTSDAGSVQGEHLGFTGKEEDEEVGLVYFGERYLIQHLGRWASADPLSVHVARGGEFGNGFRCIGGNVPQGRDPLGLSCGEDQGCASDDTRVAGEADTSMPDGSAVQSQNMTPYTPPPPATPEDEAPPRRAPEEYDRPCRATVILTPWRH